MAERALSVRENATHRVRYQTGLSRMRTVSLAGPSPRTRKRISDVRDERPQSASERSLFPAETANGPLAGPKVRENRECSTETGNSGLVQDCVVGPREDSNRQPDGYQPRHPR